MIRQGKAEKVLVVCSEYISNLLDFTRVLDPVRRWLRGRPAGPGGDDDSCDLLASAEHSDATFHEVATGRWRPPENPTGEAAAVLFLVVQRTARSWPVSRPTCRYAMAGRWRPAWGSDDIGIISAFHQPVPFLVKAWAEWHGARPEHYRLTGDTGG